MSQDIIVDYTCNTLTVIDAMTTGDVTITGDLLVLGTISPAIPNTLPLIGPMPTTWNPLTATSLVITANATVNDLVVSTFALVSPNVINNTNVLNSKNYSDISDTLHSVLHLQSTIPGTTVSGNIDNTLKVTCTRTGATQLETAAVTADVVYASNSACSSDLIGMRTTVGNTLNANITAGTVSGGVCTVQNLGAGVIQSAVSGNFQMLNTTVGAIIAGAVIKSEYINSSNPDYLAVTQACKGVYSVITNNVSGKIHTAECITCVYNNYNTSVSNAVNVVGLNIGGLTSTWAPVIGSPIQNSYGILMGASTRVGVNHTAMYIQNGAGCIRSAGRKKRYRSITTGPAVMTVDDEHIIVDTTTVSALTLLSLVSVPEMVITVRNDGPGSLLITAAFGDLISPLSSGSDTASLTLLSRCSMTLQAASVWKVLHKTNSEVFLGDKVVYRVSNTLATDNILQTDSVIYVDSLVVTLLILPTLSANTNQNMYIIRNEGPNSVSLNTSSGNTISLLSAGPNVTTMTIPSYSILRLQALTSVWKVL